MGMPHDHLADDLNRSAAPQQGQIKPAYVRKYVSLFLCNSSIISSPLSQIVAGNNPVAGSPHRGQIRMLAPVFPQIAIQQIVLLLPHPYLVLAGFGSHDLR
jgi:hypothetical protein